MVNGVLDNSVTITVDGKDFQFRVPSPLDTARIGMVSASIRRRLDPDGVGSEEALDPSTALVIRGMAMMEVLLEKSSATWAFSEVKDAKGVTKIAVDAGKFPPAATALLPAIYMEAQDAIARFLNPGAGDGIAPSAESVAG